LSGALKSVRYVTASALGIDATTEIGLGRDNHPVLTSRHVLAEIDGIAVHGYSLLLDPSRDSDKQSRSIAMSNEMTMFS
jgi:hypothetical protein